MRNVYPADFGDEEFNQKNDPRGLREFFFRNLQEIASHLHLDVAGPEVYPSETKGRSILAHDVTGQIDGDALFERCLMTLTRDEVRELLETTQAYKTAVNAESSSRVSFDSFMQDRTSHATFIISKIAAGILEDMFKQLLEEMKDS